MKQILNRIECQRKAFFESQNFATPGTKSLLIKKALLTAIKEEGFWGIASQACIDKHFGTIEDRHFQLKKEKELELKVIKAQLKRMLDHLKVENYKFIGSEVKGKIEYTNHFEGQKINEPTKLSKTFDIVLEKDDTIYVCKLSRRASILTMRKGTKNSTANSLELFLMQLIGESIYPNKLVVPAIISLTRKDESAFTTLEDINDVPFESSAGQNIYQYRFDYSPHELIIEAARAMNMKIDYKSEKNCKSCGECPYQQVCAFDNSDDIPLIKVPTQEKISGVPKFTKKQLEIVTFKKGDARVLAGAGSGKTTTLINRVLYLLSEDGKLSPADFLLITFTEKGVREMKEKLIYWLMKEGFEEAEADKFTVSTFNGFGQRILEENYRSLGFKTKPRLIERIEQIDIIKEILEQYPVLTHYNYRNPLLEMFRAKGVILGLADTIIKMKEKNIPSLSDFRISFPIEEVGRMVSKGVYDFDYATCFEMYQKYLEALKERNLIDYSDQLFLTLRILENPDIAQKYTYKHIILDEFQDTSLEQLLMIKRIRENSDGIESLLACGDDAQAIFSFRGVGLENILEFPHHFKGSKSFYMVENFRSSKQIVDLANYVIEFSPHNIKKDLKSTRNGEVPSYVICDDTSKYIVRSVKAAINAGVQPHDIAIIARTRSEIQEMNSLLKKEGIPSIMSVSERLVDNQRVIGIISLARFLVNSDDTASLMRWLEISDYQTFINEADLSKYVGIQKQIILDEINGLDDVQLVSWFKLQIHNLKCEDRAVDRLNDIVANFKDMTSAHNLLDKMDLYRSELSVELDDATYRAVTLTTVHAAKGREFKRVFVAYDKFKSESSRQKGGLSAPKDEEVRLLFVALTRAMDHLIVVSESYSSIFSKDTPYLKWINLKTE